MQNFAGKNIDTFIFHAVASHFVNGLVPVAFSFMLLTFITSNPYFDHTVFHLICVAAIAAPVTLISGIRDWRVKFHGGRAPIFYRKIKLSISLIIFCGVAISFRIVWHDPIAVGGWIAGLYVGCISMTLPVVIILGHLGGKLAFMAHQKAANEVKQ